MDQLSHKEEMNEIRLQMIDIAKLLGPYNHVKFEIKTICPYCGEYTLLLKEHDAHYWCMNNECHREGPLDELELHIFDEMMKKPRGVRL